jgi:hypothetical protein
MIGENKTTGQFLEQSLQQNEHFNFNDKETQLTCRQVCCLSDEMMVSWLEILEIAKTISYCDENDQLIWQYETNGIYSSSSMYAIVNFRGIQPIYLPFVWKLKILPKDLSFSVVVFS